MNVLATCRFCGAPLPGDAPRGLCPQCLLGTPLNPNQGARVSPAGGALLPSAGTFGDYEIIGHIAEGGMGTVYFARQMKLNRSVALKMIRSGQLASAAEIQRFRNEAAAAAALDHPGIVPIYEVGELEGWHFFSMKLVEGGNLAELNVAQTRRDAGWVHRAATLVSGLARAVHHAHERGVLHRDLKPTNVLLDEEGRPYLTDFGLAKLLRGAGGQTTGILGTPSYMAPEQAEGDQQLTTAADTYSLGAILYDLLCGQPPFQGESPLEILSQARTAEPIPPRKRNPSVPEDLETICLKCLQKPAEGRYRSAEALADDLERWLRGEPISARAATPWERSVKWARRNPALTSLAAVAVLSLVVGSITTLVLWRRAETSGSVSRERLTRLHVANGVRLLDDQDDRFGALVWFAEALKSDPETEESHRMRLASVMRQCPRLLQFWSVEGSLRNAQFSPDGERVLAVSGSNSAQVWDSRSGAVAFPVPVRHEGATKIDGGFSSDGDAFITWGGDTVRVWSAQTGKALARLPHPSVARAAIHPKAPRLATASRDGVKLWDLASGEQAGADEKLPSVRGLAWSPAGWRLLAYDDESTVYVWAVTNGFHRTALIKSSGGIRHAAFDWDGTRIVTAHADGFARIWDAETGEALADGFKEGTWLTHAEFSPDGAWVATSAGGHVGRVWDVASGKKLAQLSGHKNVVVRSAFSPGGQRIVTCSFDGTARLHESRSGWSLGPPLRHGGLVVAAEFDPAGERLLTASADGAIRIWSLWPDALTILPWADESVRILAVTRDGKLIVIQNAAREVQVWDTETWTPTASIALGAIASQAFLSPEAQRLLTVSWTNSGPACELRVQGWNLGSGTLQSSVQLACEGTIVASRDCERIARVGRNRVEVLAAASGEPVFPAREFPERVGGVRFSPDGGQLAIAEGNRLHVLDAETGTPRYSPLQHDVGVKQFEYSADGQRLVSCELDVLLEPRVARVWNAHSGLPVGTPLRHGDGIFDAHFSADGRRVITASEDNTARVWDAATGAALSPPFRHPVAVEDAAFSPDGRRVATSSHDRTARVWDALTGEPLTPRFRHDRRVGFAYFLAGGKYLLTESAGLARSIWELPNDTRPAEDLIALAGLLSGQALDATGALSPIAPGSLQSTWQALRNKYPSDFRHERRLPTIPERDPATRASLADLTAHYNAPLFQTTSELRPGVRTLGGIEFDVRGIVQLAGSELATWGVAPCPEIVRGVGALPFERVHLLHGTSGFAASGTVVAHLVIHYADGTQHRSPIVAGKDVGDWNTLTPRKPTNAQIAWTGTLRHSRTWTRAVHWYHSVRDNPFAAKAVVAIDFVSALSPAAPYLVAVTFE